MKNRFERQKEQRRDAARDRDMERRIEEKRLEALEKERNGRQHKG